jgi:hypothetical protein
VQSTLRARFDERLATVSTMIGPSASARRAPGALNASKSTRITADSLAQIWNNLAPTATRVGRSSDKLQEKGFPELLLRLGPTPKENQK